MLTTTKVMGDSLFMDFWPHWLSDLALQQGAVIISPNYRLLPEATSAQIYEDIEDFWKWVHSPALAALLANHSTPTKLDLSRILTAGESAGGLLSVYLALAHPEEIRAATAAYPWVDPVSEGFTSPRAEPPFGQHIPESIIPEVMKTLKIGTAESSLISEDRLKFMLAAVEHGQLGSMYAHGSEGVPRERLYPMARLEQPGIKIPRGGIAVIHGRQDSVVPLGDVETFVASAREITRGLPGNEGVTLTVRDGEHGFDAPVRFEEMWILEAFKMAVETWIE